MVIIAALVLAAFSMLSTQSAKASTSEAKVVSYSWYTAPSNTVLASAPGDFIVVGEVENVGSNIIANVNLTGTAFSSTGQELAATATQAFVYHTLPGQKAPFYLDFTAASSATDNLSWISSVSYVQVTVTSVTDTTDRQYSGVIDSSCRWQRSLHPRQWQLHCYRNRCEQWNPNRSISLGCCNIL